MSNLKDFVKNGWHPEKEGTTLRGQVSSLMGRNKDSSSSPPANRADHVSRPLSDLKDPSGFAPPPRRTGSGLAQPPPPPPPSSTAARRPVAASAAQRDQSPETQLATQPSRPYQVNTTGLRTDHLPPPPGRRDGADGRASPAASYAGAPATKPAPPSLPPRLPPRGARHSPPPPPSAGSSHSPDRYLNQGAVTRLGAAGVSVPGLGIGRPSPSASPPPPRSAAAVGTKSGGGGFGSRLNGLQDKFSTLGMPSDSSATPPPSQGTTWAQKQATLKTASAFHKNPSQRHGDQVEAGIKRTNNLNHKYGVMDKVGAYVNKQQTTTEDSGSPATGPGLPGKKKPPPPPPPKKKPGVDGSTQSLVVGGSDDSAPPPIPMSTRPAF
ncbi:GMP synthase [Hirsutella rhossiliensis]|uniref:GMP synthase n=1 Tax=Hirsutella rhossiliensis TaxID=111463 RepID=A0A9P8SEU3_9HYPO|nr:GMP synthase [Hirsutella rhossiliensis]KAH0960031.1 GMP synthase [Hirsutella rhossiliensis]